MATAARRRSGSGPVAHCGARPQPRGACAWSTVAAPRVKSRSNSVTSADPGNISTTLERLCGGHDPGGQVTAAARHGAGSGTIPSRRGSRRRSQAVAVMPSADARAWFLSRCRAIEPARYLCRSRCSGAPGPHACPARRRRTVGGVLRITPVLATNSDTSWPGPSVFAYCADWTEPGSAAITGVLRRSRAAPR